MKKLLLLFIFVCCQWAAQAQVFAPEGSKWWYCWRGFAPYNYTDSLVYVKDTIIGNYEYKKIAGGGDLNFIRENGDTVFRHHEGADHVLYNFSLEVGDTLRMEDGITAMYYFFSTGSYVTFELTEKGKMELGSDSVRFYKMKALSTDYDSASVFGFVPEAAENFMVAEKIGLFSNGKLLPVFLGPTVDIGVPEITRFDTSNTIGVYQNSWIISCPWLDVEEQSKQNFTQIFPNPTTGMVNITWNGNQSVSRLRIINSLGQIIETANPVNSDQTQLNLSHLATGVYYVEILFEDNKRLVEKITLNR